MLRSSFLRSLVNLVLKGLLLVSVADLVGVETTSFVAVLGGAGGGAGVAGYADQFRGRGAY
ncbi:hypothetical protein GCM10023172_00320 [Hymenobacter ginsengisoli]|uniref:Uncharacterized protein n=1 Tax=Hymenobacter ginsengisoli TaxID=1051626 RepID=A0ABP8PUV1_9BACT|nr:MULTISPECIES: hypothetical protein [unclassified Hymenobacter]MBO2033756.1 hypothetical protein [Hymenobacter sp. BT559]